jgi:hypothetical protein
MTTRNLLADPFRLLTALAVGIWIYVFLTETYPDLSSVGVLLLAALFYLVAPTWVLAGIVALPIRYWEASRIRRTDWAMWFGTGVVGCLAYLIGFIFYIAPAC